jgi:hypothetical protein
MNYSQSDSWLLLSIMYAAKDRDALLVEIIAAGDWLNHSIFNFDELKSGFAKLIFDGYFEEAEEKFRLLDKGRLLFANLLSQFRQVDQQLNLLNGILRVSNTEPINQKKWFYPKLTYQIYGAAVAEYQNSIRTIEH